jgi:NAD(P)-dependent dehydrogenase (short-subunit alcohol dehydrogenase family)
MAKKMTMMTKTTTATRSERALIYFGGYHAAKWAVGGFTESLAQGVAPFGV